MVARSFDTLPAFLKQLDKRVREGLPKTVRATAIAIDESLVRNTPVNTGKARSNWVASSNAPFKGVIPPYAPGRRLGITEQANATAAITQARSVIARFDGRRISSIYLVNNVDYIGKLNSGSSIQQPAMFVERALQTGRLAFVAAVKDSFR